MSDSSGEAASVDYEHRIQLDLVAALVNAAQPTQDLEAANEILDQFMSFSEAHFMAEQLLMRLHAYPQYEEHTKQHDNLMESCTRLRQNLSDNELRRLSDATQQLKVNLCNHMEGADRLLGAFLRESS